MLPAFSALTVAQQQRTLAPAQQSAQQQSAHDAAPPHPRLFLTLGIEGTGHHAIGALFRGAGLPVRVFSPEIFVAGAAPQHDVAKLDAKLQLVANNTLFACDSYPEGQANLAGQHPDPLALAKLPSASFTFIFTHRSLAAAVASAERRFGAHRASKLGMYRALQDELDTVRRRLQADAAASFVDVQFAWICSDPERFVATLQRVVPALLPVDALRCEEKE